MALSDMMKIVTICVAGYLQTVQSEPLVVSTLLVSPFLMAREQMNNGTMVVEYEGYIRDLLDEVTKFTGTSYKFSVRQDTKFGHLRSDGSWDGLIGDVFFGRADIAAGPLTESSIRRKYVDFSTPFMNFGPVIILKRPQPPVMRLEERFQRLYSPLSDNVWRTSGLAWLVTSAVLYIICYVNPYDWRQLCKDRQATLREGESFTCLNTFWFSLSGLLWQGYTRSPRSLGARIVVAFWWIFALIFIIMYIASMTNALRVGPTPGVVDTYAEIQNLEDLSEQSYVEYGVLDRGATDQYLGNAKTPFIRRIHNAINRLNSKVPNLKEGIEKVRNSPKPFALIAESAMAQYFTRQSPCDIYMVRDFSTIGSYSLAFPPNSSFEKVIDLAILHLRETGVLRELEDRWFKGECTDFVLESTSTGRIYIPPFYKVDLGSFSGALIILGIGLVLGSLTTGIELCVFKFAEAADKPKEDSSQPLNNSGSVKRTGGVADMEPEPITDV